MAKAFGAVPGTQYNSARTERFVRINYFKEKSERVTHDCFLNPSRKARANLESGNGYDYDVITPQVHPAHTCRRTCIVNLPTFLYAPFQPRHGKRFIKCSSQTATTSSTYFR